MSSFRNSKKSQEITAQEKSTAAKLWALQTNKYISIYQIYQSCKKQILVKK